MMTTYASPSTQLAEIKAAAARVAATGWRDLPAAPSGAESSGGGWTRDAAGVYSATLSATEDTDPEAGTWTAWPAVAGDGHPVAEEWAGAIQVTPEIGDDNAEILYGYADGPLDTATYAMLWGVVAKPTGEMRVVVWTLDNGSWSRVEADNETTDTYGATGVRGMFLWSAGLSNIVPTRSILHSARIVESDGTTVNRNVFCAINNTDLRWGDRFEAGARVWSVIAGRTVGTPGSAPTVSTKVREVLQPLDRREGRAEGSPAAIVAGLGQSNLIGQHSEGDPTTALSLAASLALGTHWRTDGTRVGPGEWAAGDCNFGSGIRSSAGHSGALHRIVVEGGASGRPAQEMIDIYMPALIEAVRVAGYPRVPVDVVHYDQGEADSFTTELANAWQAKVEALIATSRAEWGSQVIWVLVKKTATISSVQPGQAIVNAAIDAIVAADPLVFARETSSSQLVADEIHRDAQALYDDGLFTGALLTSLGRWPG
jgi:hypothetical protein